MHRAIGNPGDSRRRMAGVGPTQRAPIRIVNRINGRHERPERTRVHSCQVIIDITQQVPRGDRRAREGFDQRVQHGHQHRRRGAVPAHIGHQHSHPIARQTNDVVIITPRGRGAPGINAHVERRDTGQFRGQQGLLQFGDLPEFVLGLLVGMVQLLREQGGLGRPAKQVAHPHQFRQSLRRERSPLFSRQHDHVHRLAALEERNGQQGPLPLQERRRRILRIDPKVIFDQGFAGVE